MSQPPPSPGKAVASRSSQVALRPASAPASIASSSSAPPVKPYYWVHSGVESPPRTPPAHIDLVWEQPLPSEFPDAGVLRVRQSQSGEVTITFSSKSLCCECIVSKVVEHARTFGQKRNGCPHRPKAMIVSKPKIGPSPPPAHQAATSPAGQPKLTYFRTWKRKARGTDSVSPCERTKRAARSPEIYDELTKDLSDLEPPSWD